MHLIQFWQMAVIWYAVINLGGFIAFALDKHFAKTGKRRIMERDLILLALLGGAFGCLLGMILCHHKTRKRKFQIAIPAFVIWYLFLIPFLTYQNNNLVITRYDTGTSQGLRVVQISDLHNTVIMWDKERIARETGALDPDIIVITGDIVDSYHTDIDSALHTAAGLAKIAPVYYVTGNHEYRLSDTDLKKLTDGLASAGVTVLSDSYEIRNDGGSAYALIGLNDTSLGDGTLPELVKQARSEAGSDIKTVVLAHEPQYIDSYSESGADIVFAGHAHGGQIVCPGIGPLIAPDQWFFPKYTTGIIEKGNTKMIISRGLGNSALPFRINDYPEIVVGEI